MASNTDYSFVVSSRAQRELVDSWNWYEDRLPSLGDRFLQEVIKVFRKIENNPDRYPTRIKSYKEAQVDTFPFLVIYRVVKKGSVVRVVSVFHTAREPKKKYK